MISIGVITARKEPKFDWFFESLRLQSGLGLVGQIILIDFFAQAGDGWTMADVEARGKSVFESARKNGFGGITEWHPPKPTMWAGPSRLTKENWWHASACRNTIFCYARHDFVASLDDRFILMPTWLDAVRQAEQEKYVVCGTYEKRTGIVVKSGIMTNSGTVIGTDGRFEQTKGNKSRAPGPWVFGCTFALPLDWALAVNGQEELCDGLSMEDVIFGLHLQNSGYPIFFDPRMKMFEDRTPSELGTPMKRSSKERFPKDVEDKGHKALERFGRLKRASHHWDLRAIRESVLAGNPFPGVESCPTNDWFDGQKISEM